MIFCGDIAIPYINAIRIDNFPAHLHQEYWFGNLEGSLIEDQNDENQRLLQMPKVFNSYNAINTLLHDLHFKAFGIANNHLFDAAHIHETIHNIKRLGISYVGADINKQSAEKAIHIQDNNGEFYTIFAFGWDCINCKYASQNEEGVNPYHKKHVIQTITKELQTNHNKIICFFHWNYELELYPSPYDRALALQLIDMGVDAIIGCHAHRIQPIEFYKNKPIVYGLGNFLFKQQSYCNTTLSFPEYTTDELAFEIKNGQYWLHFFKYDLQKNILTWISSEEINTISPFQYKATFSGFTPEKYLSYFKQNRIQRKLLPIFHSDETSIGYFMKSRWVLFRGFLIDLLVKTNLKGFSRIK